LEVPHLAFCVFLLNHLLIKRSLKREDLLLGNCRVELRALLRIVLLHGVAKLLLRLLLLAEHTSCVACEVAAEGGSLAK
jgi:hypothetical protein